METKETITIAKDFSNRLGARYRKDGPYSGEEFLEEHLLPAFERAVTSGSYVLIDLDGVWGYPSSFVSGSFGKLSLDKGAALVEKHLRFKSDENTMRLERVRKEIANPREK
jgi:hypothetical protein